MPPNLDRQALTLERKRAEYFGLVEQYYETRHHEQHKETFRQVSGRDRSVGGTDRSVGGTDRSVGGTDMSVGGTARSVGGTDRSVGGTDVICLHLLT